jgi:hypothetical protein
MKFKKHPRRSWVLTILVAALAMVAAGAGLFWQADGSHTISQPCTGRRWRCTGRGCTATIRISRHPSCAGRDAVTLFVAVPLLLLTLLFWRRGSLRGKLVLAGILSYFLVQRRFIGIRRRLQ